MRRSDREVTDERGLVEIIEACKVCRIAYQDEVGLTIVPMNFGYTFEAGQLVLYIHSAREGRKVRAFSGGLSVAFEMDGHHGLTTGETPCQYGYYFASVVGNGHIAPLGTYEEKALALQSLMRQQTGEAFSFTKEMTESVQVFALRASAVSGKRRI